MPRQCGGARRARRRARGVPRRSRRGRRPDRLDVERTAAPRQRRDIHGAVLAAEWQTRRARPTRPAVDRRSSAAASRFRSAGASSRARASWPDCRSRSVSRSRARSRPRAAPVVELKWPNDLVHRHLKLGGILIELNGDALGPSLLVDRRRPQCAPAGGSAQGHRAAGHRSHDDRRPRRAADRPQPSARAPRRRARADAATLRDATASRRSRAEWQRRHAYQGKPVDCCCPTARACTGTVAGVDATARWCWPTDRAARASSRGEISLRRG